MMLSRISNTNATGNNISSNNAFKDFRRKCTMTNSFDFGFSSRVSGRLNHLRRLHGNHFVERLLAACRNDENSWQISERFGVSKVFVTVLRTWKPGEPKICSPLRLVYVKAAA